jgi:hypothetical protein
MSLWLATFAESSFDQSDWLKILGIAGAMLALYLLARRLGHGDESYPPPMETSSSTQISTSQAELVEPPQSHENEERDSEGADDEEQPTIAEEPGGQPRNIQINSWSFPQFAIEDGPSNRDSFADELTVELYDKSTRHTWTQTYLVATPAGLQKALRKNKRKAIYLPQALLMSRYDVHLLRKAVLGELGAIEDERGDVPPDDSEDDAPVQKD